MKNEKSNTLLEFVELPSWPSRYFEFGAFLGGFLLMIAFGIILVRLNLPIALGYLQMIAFAFSLAVLFSIIALVYKRRMWVKQQMIEQLKKADKKAAKNDSAQTSSLLSGELH
jgi:hypothetical protein